MLSIEELMNEAKKAREKAYARYSGFKVGAVIECKDGKLIYGANEENSIRICLIIGINVRSLVIPSQRG